MHADQLRELYEAAPFQPFDVVLPNGSVVTVDHPEFMAFSRDFRTMHFYPRNGGACHIDVNLITRVDVPAKNGAHARKRKR